MSAKRIIIQVPNYQQIIDDGTVVGNRIHLTLPEESVPPGESRHLTASAFGALDALKKKIQEFRQLDGVQLA